MEAIVDFPHPRRSDFSEVRHGHVIKDPYRWMENEAEHNEEIIEYIDASNKHADTYISRSDVEAISQKVATYYPEDIYSPPHLYGEYYWWRWQHFEGDAESVTFVRSTNYNDPEPEKVFDVSVFGSGASVDFWNCDPIGRYWVGGVQTNGSDWQTIRIYDSAEKRFLEEKLVDVKFTFRYPFTSDSDGFFYHMLPSDQRDSDGPYSSQAVYYHRLNTSQSEDKYIWSGKDAGDVDLIPFSEYVSDDGQYLFFSYGRGTDLKGALCYADINSVKAGKPEFCPVEADLKFIYTYLCTIGDEHYFFTNRNALNFCVVSWNFNSPGFETVISERREDVLKYVMPLGREHLVLLYMHDASDKLVLWDSRDKTEKDISGPSFSSISLLWGSPKSEVAFAQVENFSTPLSVYAVCASTADMNPIRPLPGPSDAFVCDRVLYDGLDKTKIGLFVSYFKDTKIAKNPPVLLFGYGGFDWAQQPTYEPFWVSFMRDLGGIVCVAGIRGGGENGLSWWEAARATKRQVAFDDFKQAARYIVSSGMTTSDKIVINGISNGGLLTAAVALQSPELVGCVITEVGLHDLVRFDQFTFGRLWRGEYGDPSKKADFDVLLKLSPYANITHQQYPPMMITTADYDDRVVPAHSLKFAAEILYQNPASAHPIVLRVYKGTGHNIGKTAKIIVHEASEKLAFAKAQLASKETKLEHGDRKPTKSGAFNDEKKDKSNKESKSRGCLNLF